MAAETFVANIAKGRTVEYYNRVENNDPSASALIIVPLSVGGTQAQGQDFDDLAALLGDANFDEQTAGGWVRKTLTDTELAAFPAPDDTNNRYDVAVPQITWTGPTAGNNVVAFAVCYDADTAAGTDSNLVFLTAHALTVNADGNDVVVNAGAFFRAS